MYSEVKIVGFRDYAWERPVPPHRRTHGGVILVKEGTGELGVGGLDQPHNGTETESLCASITRLGVRAGDVVIYLPYEDHSYHPDRNSVLHASMIQFELSNESSLAESVKFLGDRRHFRGLAHSVELFAYVEHCLAQEKEFASRAAEAAVAALLNQTIADCIRWRPATRATAVDQAMRRLYGDFGARLSHVAEDLGVSVETIRKEFRRHFGDSPMHYFAAYRISAVAFRLETEGVPLKELAEEFGFSDEFHLSRVFKRYVGVSPSEYRKNRQDQP